LRTGGATLVAIFAVGLGLLLVGLALAGVDVIRLTGDPATSADFGVSTGFFSTLGLLCWATGAGACGVAAVVLQGQDDQRFRFFVATAALIAILTFDDAFLLHERIAPDKLGIPQPLIYFSLAGLAVGWAVWFRDELVDSDVPVLICCAVAFGTSLFLDLIEAGEVAEGKVVGLEDGLKLVGIFAFTVWCFSKARAALSREADERDAEQPMAATAAAPPEGR
jgi:hypothetical protein